MKSKEEIINDSIKLETPPADYNLLEIYCFLALKQLLVMFNNKQITTENATKTKQLILTKFQEQGDYLKEIEETKIKFVKMINGKAEEAKLVTKERVCEALMLAVEIIETIFKGEF